MSISNRTTIIADPEILLQARAWAKRERTSFSEIVRQALLMYLSQKTKKTSRLSFIGVGKGPKNSKISLKAEDIIERSLDKKTGFTTT